MRVILIALTLASLTACGADGAPEAPASQDANAPGLTLSGCAKIGVAVGPKTAGGPTRC